LVFLDFHKGNCSRKATGKIAPTGGPKLGECPV
jgi:hypothetical protein